MIEIFLLYFRQSLVKQTDTRTMSSFMEIATTIIIKKYFQKKVLKQFLAAVVLKDMLREAPQNYTAEEYEKIVIEFYERMYANLDEDYLEAEEREDY